MAEPSMDALDRMFHMLVRTLRSKHPGFLTAPFTVADLYQQIMPYRHFRRELDLETNQEYELILMELLTGARGYLDVDEQLRDELGKELASSSPEPSRVREFADAHLSLNAAAAVAVPGGRGVSEGAPREARLGSAATAGSPAFGSAAVNDGSRCRYCGGDLPDARVMNFCPHCGQNLQVLNCTACGAEVEAEWKFCIACGKTVA